MGDQIETHQQRAACASSKASGWERDSPAWIIGY
jgi:hypothetical protein